MGSVGNLKARIFDNTCVRKGVLKMRNMVILAVIILTITLNGQASGGTFTNVTASLVAANYHSSTMNNRGHVVFQAGSDDGGSLFYWDGQGGPVGIPLWSGGPTTWAMYPMKLNDNGKFVYFKFTSGQYLADKNGIIGRLSSGSWCMGISINNDDVYARVQGGSLQPWRIYTGIYPGVEDLRYSGSPYPTINIVDINDHEELVWLEGDMINGSVAPADREAPQISNSGAILYRYQTSLHSSDHGVVSSNLVPYKQFNGSIDMSDNGKIVWLEMVGDAPEVFTLDENGMSVNITNGQFRYAPDPGDSIIDPNINNDGTIVFSVKTGKDMPGITRNIIVYTPSPPTGTISGLVTLQSVAAGNQSEQITFEIRIPNTTSIAADATNDEDAAKPGSQITTGSDGAYTLEGIPPGAYDLTAQGSKWLRMKHEHIVVIPGQTITVDFINLKGGDASNSNSVNVLDLNILKGSYGKTPGQPGYSAMADFNKTDSVNVLDLNILKGNYGQSGSQ
jgi:hypothetical protein